MSVVRGSAPDPAVGSPAPRAADSALPLRSAALIVERVDGPVFGEPPGRSPVKPPWRGLSAMHAADVRTVRPGRPGLGETSGHRSGADGRHVEGAAGRGNGTWLAPL